MLRNHLVEDLKNQIGGVLQVLGSTVLHWAVRVEVLALAELVEEGHELFEHFSV